MKEEKKGLLKIAKEYNLEVTDIKSIFDYQTCKMYNREYIKTSLPELNGVDQQAYNIIERYYQMKEHLSNKYSFAGMDESGLTMEVSDLSSNTNKK